MHGASCGGIYYIGIGKMNTAKDLKFDSFGRKIKRIFINEYTFIVLLCMGTATLICLMLWDFGVFG